MAFERLSHVVLRERDREISSRLLDQRPSHVGRAPQVHREGVRIVDRDQETVEVLERIQRRLRALDLSRAEQVQHVPATLTDRLGDAVQVRRVLDAEGVGARQLVAVDQREREVGLRVLLLGVLQMSRVADLGVPGDRRQPFIQRSS